MLGGGDDRSLTSKMELIFSLMVLISALFASNVEGSAGLSLDDCTPIFRKVSATFASRAESIPGTPSCSTASK